ncbi:uncharacterized protein LY89DRAFT_544882, partial [Mollisia scopiformis]
RPTRTKRYSISREQVLAIEEDMDGHWSRGSMTAAELVEHYQLGCVPQTLINAFKREGIGHYWAAESKYLTPNNMKERNTFCRVYRDDKGWKLPQYKKVLYSNTCHFAVNQRKRQKVWRR